MTPVIVKIIVTVVCIIAAWYAIGKLFKGDDKEDRRWRWRLRAASVGVLALVIGVTSLKTEVAYIGLMILFLVVGTGFVKNE